MKNMNMRQVVDELRRQGHVVTFYTRRDGGILIKTIDGQKFTGATGNMYGRALVGEKLSTKRANQLSRITWTGKRAKSQISHKYDAVKKQLERTQRIWRKAFGKDSPVGKITAKKVKWSIEHRGEEETKRLLKEAERYAKGKAYTKNIQHLVDYIRDTADRVRITSPDSAMLLDNLADDMVSNAWMIKEEAIYPTYYELYKINQGIPIEDIVRNIRRILGI